MFGKQLIGSSLHCTNGLWCILKENEKVLFSSLRACPPSGRTIIYWQFCICKFIGYVWGQIARTFTTFLGWPEQKCNATSSKCIAVKSSWHISPSWSSKCNIRTQLAKQPFLYIGNFAFLVLLSGDKLQ